MGGQKADLVIEDAPYNVRVNGHVGGKGHIKHPEFAMASGEMSTGQFTHFLTTVLGFAAQYSRQGSVHYLFMDFRHMGEILAAGRAVYDAFLNLCVWVKHLGGMGSLYRSQHELIFVFRNGRASTATTSSSGATGATAPTSGPTPASRPCAGGARRATSSPSTPPSSRSEWSPTRSSIARSAETSSWMLSSEAAPP